MKKTSPNNVYYILMHYFRESHIYKNEQVFILGQYLIAIWYFFLI